jgi:hypothetical protein
MRPEYPQGNVKIYHLLICSAINMSISVAEITPQDHGEDVVFEYQFIINLHLFVDNMSVSIIVETEYGMKGDRHVISIGNNLTASTTQPCMYYVCMFKYLLFCILYCCK